MATPSQADENMSFIEESSGKSKQGAGLWGCDVSPSPTLARVDGGCCVLDGQRTVFALHEQPTIN